MEQATYSKPFYVGYSFGLINFATGNVTHALNPPYRMRAARVAEISARVTVTFTATTTPGYVNLGTGGNATKYAQMSMATTAAGATQSLGTAIGAGPESAVVFSDVNFDRDGVNTVQLQVLAPTGGAPAGSAYLDIEMAWF